MTGTVIRLLLNRGFGFVRGTDGLSRFFEAKEVIPPVAFDTMREGQAVSFVPIEVPGKGNGLRARQVQVVNHA